MSAFIAFFVNLFSKGINFKIFVISILLLVFLVGGLFFLDKEIADKKRKKAIVKEYDRQEEEQKKIDLRKVELNEQYRKDLRQKNKQFKKEVKNARKPQKKEEKRKKEERKEENEKEEEKRLPKVKEALRKHFNELENIVK